MVYVLTSSLVTLSAIDLPVMHHAGRRSFGGFNKAVERNYEHMMDEKRFDKASERASKNSVSDAEMLARYENLIGLPRGPSQGMRPKQEKTTKQKEDQKKNASNHSR